MPQSLSQIILHIVFSTKHREPYLDESIRSDVFAFLANAVRNHGCECYRVGGANDHVHLAIRLSRTITVSELVRGIKSASSRWIKTLSDPLRTFAWQSGYGVFSVGYNKLDTLIRYIDNQDKHHRRNTFVSEYSHILRLHNINIEDLEIWE